MTCGSSTASSGPQTRAAAPATMGAENDVPLSAPTSHLHYFEFGEVAIDVEVTSRVAFCGLLGAVLDPAGLAGLTVTLESATASFTTETDGAGRFVFDQVPCGLVRLHLERSAARLTTRWFEAG